MHIDTDCNGAAASGMDAMRIAKELQESLDYGEDLVEVLAEFHAQMAGYRNTSYAELTISGSCTIAEAFVWWMDDQSILVVGWQDEDTVVVGVLPQGSEFAPQPYHDGKVVSLH